MKLNAAQLRKYARKASPYVPGVKNEIYIILDNVLDTYNIGSIFRLADAVAARKVFLCGQTATPPNHRIKKASINTTEVVEWEYCESAVEAVNKVRNLWKRHPERSEGSLTNVSSNKLRDSSSKTPQNDKGGLIVAVEQSVGSIPFNKFEYKMPIAIVVGHESFGVSKEVLEMADAVVELPMFGVNISLNVMVSLGIVLYQVISKNNP